MIANDMHQKEIELYEIMSIVKNAVPLSRQCAKEKRHLTDEPALC